VRQIHSLPGRVVESRLRKFKVACLGKVSLVFPEVQILQRIVGIAEFEFPPEIRQQLFPRRFRRQSRILLCCLQHRLGTR
jgi:hypothetical protein